MKKRNFKKLFSSVYAKGNRLCIIGVHESIFGPIPFGHNVRLSRQTPDGPIDLSNRLPKYIEDALKESAAPIMNNLKTEEMKLAAESLVERARCGDQVAMANIVLVRKNKNKNFRANRAYKLIYGYIKANPPKVSRVGFNGEIGEDLDKSINSLVTYIKKQNPTAFVAALKGMVLEIGKYAISSLANGPNLLGDKNKYITETESSYSGNEKKAFKLGYNCSDDSGRVARYSRKIDKKSRAALAIGCMVGMARRIQAVRLPESPISILSLDAAWELGE